LSNEGLRNEEDKRGDRGIRRARFLIPLLVFQFIYAIFFSKIYFRGLGDIYFKLSAGGICEVSDSFGSYRTLLFLSGDAVNELYSLISSIYGENNLSVLLTIIISSSSVAFYFGFCIAMTGCVTKDLTCLEMGLIVLLISDFFFNVICLTVGFASLTFVGWVYTVNLSVLVLFLFFSSR